MLEPAELLVNVRISKPLEARILAGGPEKETW